MFLVHDLIDTKGACGRLKVVWAAKDRTAIAVVDEGKPTSWPVLHDAEDLKRLALENHWIVEVGDPPHYMDDAVYLGGVVPENRGRRQAHLTARDAAWKVLGPLVRDQAIYSTETRASLVANAAGELGVTTTTVRTKLIRLFHGGLLPGALLPGYARCGAPGEPRPVKEGGKKSGPPAKRDRPNGVPVTEEMKRIFRIGFDWFEHNGGQTLAAAYWHSMRIGFFEQVEELFAKSGSSPPYEECEKLGLPRQEQFRYHWGRERKRIEALEKRMGARLFALKRRALKGDSTGEATGPGDMYQIDATVLNVYTRSRRNRRKLVWRATLYIVVDVWSRMIVGFALSLDPASWLGAMTALANAMTNKREFCAAAEMTITDEQWPCHHLPGSIVGDQAELARAGVLGLIDRHGVEVANPPAYRADWKGIVERRFGMIDGVMKPFMPGFVHVDFRERGVEDYRLATVMTLDELTRQVIRCILYYNNIHPLASYPRLPAMNEDNVPSVPRDLWNWGIANCSGIPRQPDEESVRFSLMEQDTATMWADGIHFHGCVYMCEKAEGERWRERARDKGPGNGRFGVPISFDRRTTDFIYVHDPDSPKGFQVGTLVSERRAKTSHWEIAGELQDESDIQARQKVVAAVGRIDHDGGAADEAERASAAMDETPSARSDAAEVSDIRGNTADERKHDQLEQLAAYHAPMIGDLSASPESPSSAPPASEKPFGAPANDDHARPSRRDRLNRRK